VKKQIVRRTSCSNFAGLLLPLGSMQSAPLGVRLLVWEASSMGLHGREGIQARMKQDKMSINHPEQQLQNATSCRCYFTATII